MKQNRILSGVQPTGNLHLGNYLGAIKNFVLLQKDYECLFMLANLHAITVKHDPKILHENIIDTTAAFLASGIDPKKKYYIYPIPSFSTCRVGLDTQLCCKNWMA